MEQASLGGHFPEIGHRGGLEARREIEIVTVTGPGTVTGRAARPWHLIATFLDGLPLPGDGHAVATASGAKDPVVRTLGGEGRGPDRRRRPVARRLGGLLHDGFPRGEVLPADARL